jgi:N-acetylmuramic acid 6-phosphate etherase
MTLKPTEQRNQRTVDIDVVSTSIALRQILAEDREAIDAVLTAVPSLSQLVEETRARLAAGGRLHYFGAGASGRLAVLDATELTPTFGVERDRVAAHFPGGTPALTDSEIDLEDADELGERDAAEVAAGDIAIGITASGTTPYVEGALRAARANGAATALVTNMPNSPLASEVTIAVLLNTGPEALTGSTRLKAGTATKVALNAVSTAVMIGLGKTYSNLMVGVVASNDKLRDRAIRILAEATGASDVSCRQTLDDSGGRLPVALVSMLGGLGPKEAAAALGRHGSVRAAVERR